MKRTRTGFSVSGSSMLSTSSVMSWLLLLSTSMCLANATKTLQSPSADIFASEMRMAQENDISVGGLIFPETCHAALVAADTGVSSPGAITPEEYVTFAQLLGPPGIVDDVENFVDLPIHYSATFSSLACLCDNPVYGGDPNDAGCCLGERANIRIPAPPGPNQSPEDFRFLYLICGLTDEAASQTLREMPTASPTPVPATNAPTRSPTQSPTDAPSPNPTPGPTPSPTDAPTSEPTQEPTPQPTDAPNPLPTTLSPTDEPSPRPTSAPTSSPTATPTVSPTQAPIPEGAPTPAPATDSPTSSTPPPVPESTARLASVTYEIAVQDFVDDGDFIRDYVSDLVAAMDGVSQSVAANEFLRRKLLRQNARRLAVIVQLPTRIRDGDLQTITCPETAPLRENEICQSVTAELTLVTSEEDNNDEAVIQFQDALDEAIVGGQLQQELLAVNDLSHARVITGTESEDRAGGGGLSSGQTAGIVFGALLLGIVPIALFLVRRNREDKPDDEGAFQEFEGSNSDVKSANPDGVVASSLASGSIYTDTAGQAPGGSMSEVDPAGVFMSGSVHSGSDHLKSMNENKMIMSTASKQALRLGEDAMAEPELDIAVAGDSSSNAGSSGWSSSAGISSLNTGSLDDSMDAAAAAGTSLAAIGATSALAQKLEKGRGGAARRDSGDDADVPAVSREELDSLIESGDWAAVGATAALLAAASDSQSNDTRSKASRSRASNSGAGSIDAQRAAELDVLVDAGDWEGIVFAAAKFEQESESSASASDRNGGGSSSNNSSEHSRSINSSDHSRTDTSATAGSPSIGGTSSSVSEAAKRAEYRKEVEELVQRVVPEEIDNVDEMMNQFKGREEELVETLRTMQERVIAKKARQTGNKKAKIEARRNVQRGVVPGAAAVAANEPSSGSDGSGAEVAAAGAGLAAVTAAAAAAKKKEGSGSASDQSSDAPQTREDKKSALESAIETGDWEAVGQAAAMLSDASATTASTGEINKIANTALSVSSKGSGAVAETRAAELDAMIEKGNWTGVMDAANKYNADDKAKGGTTSVAQSKEEEEALAQAEVWMKIAEQKKKAGATDEGASDAAEWAISRSLSQLKEAERKAQKQSQEEDEV